MNKTTGAVIIMTMGSVLAAGCGLSGAAGHPSNQATGTHSAATPTSTTTVPATTGSSPSSSSTSSQSVSPATSASGSGSSGAARPSGSSEASGISRAGVQRVKAWMQSGLHGEGLNMPIGDGKTIDAVQKEWGKGQNSAAGAGIYVTYPSHGVAFGVGTGDQIFDVRSNALSIRAITRSDVTTALGPPAAVRYADNTTIYMYPDGPDYQVLWTFAGGPGQTGTTVDHVSVFWPQGTVNLMGQTVPNPSVVVTKNPGGSGSYLQFSITNAPSGYRLDELEWLPSGQGATVVNTESQALYNAEHGVSGNVFMNTYGAYRFQFTASQKGTSGRIRLIYESPRGNAIIGTSSTITLH
ncbi:YjgB family protein [Sulfobacillus harzensis]|uniref:YjgB family protein n=1 Tax=Sulfobacillus harzensis TaxID=2729629 RepID=A0A7Y0LA88_9FIRM|nr:YjgB family protein [Sulfobacillus harzensis]NMP24729.1 YjgB family protein [Sulfobacillus harzensis]